MRKLSQPTTMPATAATATPARIARGNGRAKCWTTRTEP